MAAQLEAERRRSAALAAKFEALERMRREAEARAAAEAEERRLQSTNVSVWCRAASAVPSATRERAPRHCSVVCVCLQCVTPRAIGTQQSPGGA